MRGGLGGGLCTRYEEGGVDNMYCEDAEEDGVLRERGNIGGRCYRRYIVVLINWNV